MISRKRWKYAQSAEIKYQLLKEQKARQKKGGIDSIIRVAQKKTDYIVELLNTHKISLNKDMTVMEIGSGSHGMIWKFPVENRIAVDPLADEYFKKFRELHDNGTQIISCQGESIPIESATVDIVICENVLDHTETPIEVLNEVSRILKSDGTFYCSVDFHSLLWKYACSTYNFLFNLGIHLNIPAFPAHPHHFTKTDLENLFSDSKLDIKWVREPKEEKTTNAKNTIKKLLGKDRVMELIATLK